MKNSEPLTLLTMTFQVSEPEDQLLGWMIHNTEDSLRGTDVFSDAERNKGFAVIHGVGKASSKENAALAPGEYYIFALAKNQFGVYRSAGFTFRAE